MHMNCYDYFFAGTQGNWSLAEDKQLLLLQHQNGNAWSTISLTMGGRTPQQCRARFVKIRSVGKVWPQIVFTSCLLEDLSDNLTPFPAVPDPNCKSHTFLRFMTTTHLTAMKTHLTTAALV